MRDYLIDRTAGADLRPLPENVEGHTMLYGFAHLDGRQCAHHHRLGMWTPDGRHQCLRYHPDPAELMRRRSNV